MIGLYYYGEVTMKQIGAEIGVNESRVSQLHARAIRRLRDALGDMNPQKVAEMRRQLIAFAAKKPRWSKAADADRKAAAARGAPASAPPRRGRCCRVTSRWRGKSCSRAAESRRCRCRGRPQAMAVRLPLSLVLASRLARCGP